MFSNELYQTVPWVQPAHNFFVIAVPICRRYFQKFEICRNIEEFITTLYVVILPYIIFTKHKLCVRYVPHLIIPVYETPRLR